MSRLLLLACITTTLAACTSEADKATREEMRDALERIAAIMDGSEALPLATPCSDYEAKADRWRRAGAKADKVRRYTEVCSHDEPVKLVKRYLERADAHPTLAMTTTGCLQSLLALDTMREAARRQERALLSDVMRRCCGSTSPATIDAEEVRRKCTGFGDNESGERKH